MPEQQPSGLGTGNLHAGHGVAGLIALALAMIFTLHVLGFRFVVSAGVGR